MDFFMKYLLFIPSLIFNLLYTLGCHCVETGLKSLRSKYPSDLSTLKLNFIAIYYIIFLHTHTHTHTHTHIYIYIYIYIYIGSIK